MRFPTADELKLIPTECHRPLMEAAADHFGLPTRTCRIRNCRRLGICRVKQGTANISAEPPCFANLSLEQRGTMLRLEAVLAKICHGILSPLPATAGDQKWLHENGLAIMRLALPRMPDRTGRFVRWYEDYIAPPASPIDTAALLREVRAELARGKEQLAIARLLERSRR